MGIGINELEIFDHLQRKRFFKEIEDNKINLKLVTIKKKETNKHFHKFNVIIDRMVETGFITLHEIAIYLFKDYFDTAAEVLGCFDDNNKWALREEMNLMYHKPSMKNKLDNFMF